MKTKYTWTQLRAMERAAKICSFVNGNISGSWNTRGELMRSLGRFATLEILDGMREAVLESNSFMLLKRGLECGIFEGAPNYLKDVKALIAKAEAQS